MTPDRCTRLVFMLACVVLVGVVYLDVANWRYRLRHPHMTETEIVLHFKDWVVLK